MNKLVFVKNDRVVTDSLTVAEVFGKRHDNVLKDIREMECSEQFSLLNFKESKYTNDRGREYTKYFITEKGFTLLVMGYTGEKAMEFKERYIEEFEAMKEELKSPRVLSNKEQLVASMKLSLENNEEIGQLKQEVSDIKSIVSEQMTINYSQAQAIRNAKNKRVETLWANGSVNKEVHDTKAKLHAAAWRDIKNAFGANSYHNIRSKDYDEAMNYTKAWRPRIV